MAKSKSVDLKGQVVFVGIDVDKVKYALTCIVSGVIVKKCCVPASPHGLVEFFQTHFPEAVVRSVYEAGYFGFELHRVLEEAGVDNIVIDPASVEVAANDRVKTDKIDSKKLAELLAANRLKGIRIPSREEEDRRVITRTRRQVVCARTRAAAQIKGKLRQFGFDKLLEKRQVCASFLEELDAMQFSAGLKAGLMTLSSIWRSLDDQIKKLELEIEKQAKTDSKCERIYRSVPGFAEITARTLANELGDMSQFANEAALYSFVGLTPTEHSSGDKRRQGHISRQGRGEIRSLLVEGAWRVIQKDAELKNFYASVSQRRGGKRAIVAVARKLIGRIRACFKADTIYKYEKIAA